MVHALTARFSICRTRADRLAEIGSVVGLVILVALPLLACSGLPDRVPVHFDVAGNPDSWSGRWTVFGPPIVALALYAGLTILARFPHTFNYAWKITRENARAQYRLSRSMVIWLKAEMVWLFAYIEWRILQTATGESDGLDALFLPISSTVLFGTIAYLLFESHKAR